MAAYTTNAPTRARVDGNTVASFHMPAGADEDEPDDEQGLEQPHVEQRRGRHRRERRPARGVGLVAPAPVLFQPDTNESSISRGLSGNGRNSPTAGTPPPKKVRLPTTTPTMTQIQAITGAVVPSFQRRTVASSDT